MKNLLRFFVAAPQNDTCLKTITIQMPQERTYQTEAVVIKKTKLGEADRILTLYTRELGKIRGVAKGVRRHKSKLAGHLEVLTYSQVSLARGKNLDTIIGSQTIEGFLTLKNDLTLTSAALYAADLVEQFTEDNVANQPLFALFIETMKRLVEPVAPELTLRFFEVNLFNCTGYRPQLHQCVACRQSLTPTINSFCPGLGGVLCPTCHPANMLVFPISVNALKVLRLMQSSDYATTARLHLDPELAAELERLLKHYIRFILEREVKSAAWLDTLKRSAPA